MAALNFPLKPVKGTLYTANNGLTYVFDGIKWVGSSVIAVNTETNALINNGNVIQVTSNGGLQLPNYILPATTGTVGQVLQWSYTSGTSALLWADVRSQNSPREGATGSFLISTPGSWVASISSDSTFIIPGPLQMGDGSIQYSAYPGPPTVLTNVLKINTATQSTGTSSGALVLQGGIGVSGNGWFGGALNASSLNVNNPSNSNSINITGASDKIIVKVSTATGKNSIISYNNTSSAYADLVIAAAIVTFAKENSQSNLTIDRSGNLNIAATSVSASPNTGALIVAGGVGVGGAVWIGTSSYIAGSQIITAATAKFYSVSTIRAGTDTNVSVNTNTGIATVWSTATLQSITARNNTTNQQINITNAAQSFNTFSGALTVVGGVGIAGAMYIGAASYINNYEIVTVDNLIDYITGTSDVRIAINANSGVVISNTSTLQSVTTRGNSTTNSIAIRNSTPGTNTASAALTVVGGVGIGGAVYIGTTSYVANSQIVTAATIKNFGVTKISVGTDTAISNAAGLGDVVVWNTSTLQSITSRGSSTNQAILIANTSASASSTSGALVVRGGVGIGGTVYIANTSYIGGAQIITTATIGNYAAAGGTSASGTGTSSTFVISNSAVAVGTNSGALQVAGGAGIGGSLYAGDVYTNGKIILPTVTQVFTATNRQTIFTVTNGYMVGSNIQVFANGILLVPSDYTASNGVSIELRDGRNINDLITVISGAASGTASSNNIITQYFGQNLGIATALNFTTGTTATIVGGVLTVSATNTSSGVTFTGGTVTNAVNIISNVASTSTATGALTVNGGVGVGGDLYVGGAITATNVYVNGYSVITATFTGGTVTNAVAINSISQSTSTTTGALTVRGGVGIGGNLTVGGAITATNIYVNGYAVNTSTAGTLGAQYFSQNLGTVNTLNFANGTTATLVGGVLTIQATTGSGGGATFTGGTVANAVNIASAAASTSNTTGALTVIGGVGIGGNMYVGGAITATNIYINGYAISTVSGATFTGGTVTNTVNITSSTQSTSTTSGALTVAGGVGIGGELNLGSNLNVVGVATATSITVTSLNGINAPATGRITFGGLISPTIIYADSGQILLQPSNNGNAVTVNPAGRASTSSTTGALVVDGGVGIGGTAYIDTVKVQSTAASTSTVTGALTVIGGVGVGGNVNVGGTINAQGVYMNGQIASIISTNSGLRPTYSTTTEAYSLIDVNLYGQYSITALNSTPLVVAITTSLSLPLDGQRLIIRIRDNGVSRSLFFTTGTGQLRQIGLALPTMTVPSKVLYIGAIYNQSENYWDVLSYQQS